MAAALTVVFCLVSFLSQLTNSETNSALLLRVMGALENLAQYFQMNFHDLNIDGLFGIRVLEGQIQVILDEYSRNQFPQLDAVALNRLVSLKTAATKISKEAIEFVKRDDEKYYQVMSFVIGSPWNILKPHKAIEPRLRWHPEIYIFLKHKGARLDELMSDRCMAELTGSLRRDGKSCQISQECVSIMTERGYTGYGITHQILWTMLAEKAGCSEHLNQRLASAGLGSIEHLQLEFCTNNFFEMQDVVDVMMKGTVLPRYQDLFLEDEFVCPSLGFYEFLKLDYIEQILSWQKDNGCYGMMNKPNEPKIRMEAEKNDYEYLDDTPEERAQKVQMRMQKEADKLWGHSDNNHQVPELDMEMVEQNYQNEAIGEDEYDNTEQVNLADPVRRPRDLQENDQHDRPRIVLKNVSNDRDELLRKVAGQSKLLELPRDSSDQLFQKNVGFDRQGGGGDGQMDVGNVVVQNGPNLIAHFNENLPRRQKRQVAEPSMVGRNLFHLDYKISHHPGRRLFAEKALKEDCLAHKTAVATGALMMYLYYLLHPGPLSLANNTRPIDPYEVKDMAFFETDHDPKFKSDVGENKFDGTADHPLVGVHLNNVAAERNEAYNEEEADVNTEEEEDEDEEEDDEYYNENQNEDVDRRVVHFGQAGDRNVVYRDEEEDDTYADDGEEDEDEYDNTEDDENEEQGEEEAAYAYYDDNKAKHLALKNHKLSPLESRFGRLLSTPSINIRHKTGGLEMKKELPVDQFIVLCNLF
ncbi:hypothetical protein ScPMuIL_013745 [Solemya velum]